MWAYRDWDNAYINHPLSTQTKTELQKGGGGRIALFFSALLLTSWFAGQRKAKATNTG